MFRASPRLQAAPPPDLPGLIFMSRFSCSFKQKPNMGWIGVKINVLMNPWAPWSNGHLTAPRRVRGGGEIYGAGPENTNEGRDRAFWIPTSPVHHSAGSAQHSSAHTNTRQVVKTDLGPADVYGRHICPGRGAPAPARCAGQRDGKTENKAAEGFKWVDGHMVGVSRSVPAPPPTPPPRALSMSWVGVRANHEWSRLHPPSSSSSCWSGLNVISYL